MPTSTQILKTYWQHVWKYPKYVIGLLLVAPLGTITFRLLPPVIAAHILQKLSQHDYSQGAFFNNFGKDLLLYSLAVLSGGIVISRITSFLLWKLESFATRDLDRTMFDQFINLSATYHSNNFGGALVSQTTKFVGSFSRLVDTFIYQFYTLLISIIFMSLVLYSKAPWFVWTLLSFSAVYIAFTLKFSKRIRELNALEASAQNKATGYLADAITNIMTIKSFASYKYERKRFRQATENVTQRSLDTMHASLKMQFYASLITSGLPVMAVVLATMAVVSYGINASTVFLMFTYSAFIADGLWTFSFSTVRNYNRSIGDAREAVKTLQTLPSVKDPKDPEELRIKDGEIEFKDVVFDHENIHSSYDALFHDFNLQIKPGKKVGLVGHSGGGKTTLVKLILRFMDIDSGEVLIDGQNIAHITQDDLRKSMTYVPQEPLLFHRTLAENISYGKLDATKEEIIKVAKMAHADEFIKTLPNGYETLVGERGVKLSGGQRQRVAIARAMLKDAPILLLDEATSALDSESEVLIQDALWKLMEGKTAVVIAHRLSTIQKMDRILVLDSGNIVEEGTHKELLEKSGTYAKLWAHQSGGFLED
jgi:ATP-binding cassette subfamily B protein